MPNDCTSIKALTKSAASIALPASMFACLALLLPLTVAAQTIAVIHARAYPMTTGAGTGGLIENATILIRDGRYESVVANAPAPSDARVVDAEGKIVTPGLMNADTHLGLVEVSSLEETRDHSVADGPLGAAFDVQYGLNPNSVLLPNVLADGLTRAATSPAGAADSAFQGFGAVLRIVPGGDILDRARAALYAQIGGGADKKAGGSRSAQWQLLRNALDEAKLYTARSGSIGAPRDQQLNALNIAALSRALQLHAPLVLHASRESDIRQAVAVSAEFGLPLTILGGAEAWRCADLLKQHKASVIVDPEADLPWNYDELGARADSAAVLQRAGVIVAFTVSGNTIYQSHNAGVALREAAGLAVANGLPYLEALRSLTVNPAMIFGIADHYGSMARGLDADLVVWNGDPLEPATGPELVLVRGVPASKITRQTLLRDRYAPNAVTHGLPPAYRP